MTYLCVAIFVTDLPKAKRDMALAAEAGADIVELRIDQFTDPRQLPPLLDRSLLPCIVTCRPISEGGRCELPSPERLALLLAAQAGKASYIDIELETIRHTKVPPDCRPFIVSSHDFTGRPERLYNILDELNASPASVAKIVWTARSIRDNLEAFEILQHKTKPTIAFCMGEHGLISRILTKKFGAFLTFCTLDNDPGTAPGQIPISDMKKLYRWDFITEKTKVYGVVANPVKHSMSPAIHNAAFDATNYDGIYLPLLVEPSYESFKAFIEEFVNFDGLHLAGLSITIPHKQNALRYLRQKNAEVEPLAQSIGSVNTIIIDRTSSTPRLRGINTDYAAILDSITAKLNITRQDLAGRNVAVLGAGGTGRTAVAALAHYGATVTVYNRTRDRADELAREFGQPPGKVAAAPLESLRHCTCPIIINTTSVGMSPNVDQSPLGQTPPPLGPDNLVFDSVYNPMKTRLLTQAQAAGARTISGVEMFVRQAVAQFEAWTGQRAPSDVMRQVIERRLAH